jgi:hypothetical protein
MKDNYQTVDGLQVLQEPEQIVVLGYRQMIIIISDKYTVIQ